MTFFSFTQALSSTPRAFSSHNLVGTKLKPSCPWFLQLLFSRQALTPKASLAGLLSPDLEALAPGPEHNEGAETVNAVTISLHPRFTTNISGFPGRGQGSQRRAGESRAHTATAECRTHRRVQGTHCGVQAAAGEKTRPRAATVALRRSATPARWPERASSWQGHSARGLGWVRLDPGSSLLPSDCFGRSALSKGAQSPSLSYHESTASEAPGALTGRWLGCWTGVVEGTQVAATSPSRTRS